MKERDSNFERQLVERLGEIIPPEEALRDINPWSKPLGFITWGLVLTTLRLNLLYLQYLLPAVGVILIFLGFRSLRNENKYFKVLWIFAVVRLLWQLAEIIMYTTPLNRADYPEFTVGAAALAFQVTMFLLFHKALQAVYKKADKPVENSPLPWAAVWAVAAFLIAISSLAQSWLVFIPMVVFYVLVIRSLLSVGEQLDDTGYVLRNAPVKVGNRTFGWVYLLVTLAAVLGCSIYYNHLQLEPREFQPPETTAARQHLLALDFPAEALQYLGEQDIATLGNAVNVEVFNKMLMFDPERVEHKEGVGGRIFITHTYEPGKKNLEGTTIYIEMPDNVMYVMQYFRWAGGKPIWQDGIMIAGDQIAGRKEIISSALFYWKRGRDYFADFPRLVCDEVTVHSMFGTYKAAPIMGALSFPFGAKNQRGYVLYRYTVPADSAIYTTYAVFSYIHRAGPLRIPYARTEDLIAGGAYLSVDELNQLHTTYESRAFQEKKGNTVGPSGFR